MHSRSIRHRVSDIFLSGQVLSLIIFFIKLRFFNQYGQVRLGFAQTAKYGTGPDEAHQPEVKIRTSPHHKGLESRTDPHSQRLRDPLPNFLSQDLHPQSFVCKSLAANTCHKLIPIFLSPKSSSTNLRPKNSIQKLKFAEDIVCKTLQILAVRTYLSPRKRSQRLLKPSGWRGGRRSEAR